MHMIDIDFRHSSESPYFFKGLSMQLEPNRIHALHGKNGAGKTVLLNLLRGKVPPGAVVKGKILGSEKVALVNQRFDHMLVESFSFAENIQFARMKRFPSPFSKLKGASPYPELLRTFHIDPNKPVFQLSGGQRQILALLMVLQQNKEILLLDEPTATLDEENAKMVFEFLRALPHLTCLVVCHDVDLIRHYATGNHFHLLVSPQGVRELHID